MPGWFVSLMRPAPSSAAKKRHAASKTRASAPWFGRLCTAVLPAGPGGVIGSRGPRPERRPAQTSRADGRRPYAPTGADLTRRRAPSSCARLAAFARQVGLEERAERRVGLRHVVVGADHHGAV